MRGTNRRRKKTQKLRASREIHAASRPKLTALESGWSHVYRLVKEIPRGRVVTYGQLARALKLPGGARTAGRAMAGCPAGQGVPWHRVLGAGGRLLIREEVAALQRRLLETEGVTFRGSRVDLARHNFNFPSRASGAKTRSLSRRR